MDEELPIGSYGAIGNREMCALVGTNGSIDWCPLPFLDSTSAFTRILDLERGGHFRLRPMGNHETQRRYVPRTAVLETAFETTDGEVLVTDFVPPVEDDDSPQRALYRKVTCRRGTVDLEMEFRPRFDYARAETTLRSVEDGVVATGSDEWLFLATATEPEVTDGTARTAVPMNEDETRWFVLQYDTPASVPEEVCERRLEQTIDYWHEQTHNCKDGDCPVGGPHHELATRSGIVLQMLASRETGAIAGAGTTSLPEDVGGVRNWDYRFSWIRDSAATAQLLYTLDQDEIADEYQEWFMNLCAIDHPGDIQPIQGLHGGTDLKERTLDHLAGYRESRPVRIGNGAASQTQLDIYGELLLAIDQSAQYGDPLTEDRWEDLRRLIDYVCDHWEKKGSGVWEMPGDPKQFTHSKLMCWVALDRGIEMANRNEFDAPFDRWRTHRERIRAAVEKRGYDEDRESFVQTFDPDRTALDVTSLRIPLLGFLSFDDDRVQNTIDATIETLATDKDLVYRYDVDDGLPGQEGAFVRASSWLVNALVLSGRLDEAETFFEALTDHVNDLNLLSEEIDPETGELLGNFPQAFSHLGLANSILYLNYAQGNDISPDPIAVRLGRGGILVARR